MAEGQSFAAGDILAEIETDKATMGWESQEDGIMGKIFMPEGSKDIVVGTVVAVTVEDESELAGLASYKPGGGSASPPAGGETASSPSKQKAEPATAPSGSSVFPPHQVRLLATEPAPACVRDMVQHSLPRRSCCTTAVPASASDVAALRQVWTMPALSPTMEQGNIIKWFKQVGDEVAAGDGLVEVETDKATMMWESVEEGFVAKILAPDGTQDIKVRSSSLSSASHAARAPFGVDMCQGPADTPKETSSTDGVSRAVLPSTRS